MNQRRLEKSNENCSEIGKVKHDIKVFNNNIWIRERCQLQEQDAGLGDNDDLPNAEGRKTKKGKALVLHLDFHHDIRL